jgi:hypothetical protein
MTVVARSQHDGGEPFRLTKQRNRATAPEGKLGDGGATKRSTADGSHRRIPGQDIQMAKSSPRRPIIREWMSLTREKRQSN